jgi:hypothetical protein
MEAEAAQSSRQLGPTEGRLTYSSVVAGATGLQQTSGLHKSAAKGSNPTEPAASAEAATRRMSLVDMSGPQCGMLDGATSSAQTAPSYAVPPGEWQNKTPVYVSGVTDTRGFLAWLRGSSKSGLSAQLKGARIIIVPQTADGFRATVSALHSLDGNKGVSFHTFSLPEDRCVRLLIKKVGRNTPEEVVREELETLGIQVQEVLQLRSGRRDQETTKTRPLTPHFIVSIARGPEVAKVRSLTELCGLRISVETYAAPKGPLQCKRCQRFGHTQRFYGYAPRCVACVEAHLSGECSTSQQQHKCYSCGGNHMASYRGCAKWKEAKAALAQKTPIAHKKVCGAPTRTTKPVEPSAEQQSLGSSWNHVVRGGRVVKGANPPSPKPAPVTVTETPNRVEVTTTTKKGKTIKSRPKVKQGLKKATETITVKPAKPTRLTQ